MLFNILIRSPKKYSQLFIQFNGNFPNSSHLPKILTEMEYEMTDLEIEVTL